MLESGYIKLYRSLLTWEWYDDPNTLRLFLHLLLTVNHEPQQWRGVTIERGQRVSSLSKLGQELGLSTKEIRTALRHLTETGEVAHCPTAKYGVFTVNNYDKFQTRAPSEAVNGTQDGQSTGIEQGTHRGTQRATKEEGEEVKKKEKEIPPISPTGEETPPEAAAEKFPYEEYRKVFCEECPSLKCPHEASRWTAARKKSLRSKKVSLTEFRDVCKKIERSDFLSGRSGSWPGCSFDWMLKPANWQKIVEGNYDNRDNGKSYDIGEFEELSRFAPLDDDG